MKNPQDYFRINFSDIENNFSQERIDAVVLPTPEKLIEAYEMMLLIREFETKTGALYQSKKIGGFCHLYIGQEAVAVGNVFAADKGDDYITSYRDHGLMLACGSDPVSIMSELTGRGNGCSKGKGGSMHIFDVERRFFGGHGIVGAQVPLGTGLAFAIKYLKKPNVAFTYMGDGAVSQGQFYEAMNMASLWDLPVVYMIENNGYSMGTSLTRTTYDTNLSNRGLSFGIPGIVMNGMDFIEVYKTIKLVRDYVTANSRPILIEARTYRYKGHSVSDPAKYRTKEEVEQYKNLDPLISMEAYLVEGAILQSSECEAKKEAIIEKVQEIIKIALDNPEPSVGELYSDVYA